jgi:predicted lipoprotein with Yx(FWY)xxD motif
VAIALADNKLGKILVDGEGRTLYLFTKDTPTVPACVGDCLSNWPPLTDATAPTIGDGLAAADFGTVALADGSQQITFHGHQLYYFAADSTPGDANGQGIGGSWFVVDSAGNAIQ